MNFKLEPTLWPHNTGQRIPCFDRYQLTIRWISSFFVLCALYSEGAVGVVNKGALTLDDAELKITIRKPVKELPIDTKRLLVKGLSDKTTRDGLQSYMEVVSRVEVLSIEFGEQGSAAVIFGKTYGKFD